MAFDQATRNRLSSFVGEARSLLSEEFTRQLKQDYGLDPDRGEVTELEKLTHLDDARLETARILQHTLAHYETGLPSEGAKARVEALQRIVREQAFTVLNRLCALRMAESRGLLIESIAQGYQSDGFQLYTRLAGSSLGEMGDAYRNYLFSVFDELTVDLAVLFDRFSPQGRLFPRKAVLTQLLDAINHAEMESLWAEDETIGWIYQYFNSTEERRQMRAESSAPRNSRELAVRNQFFTPRYVVEFLTDNTLGRIWYEMRKGDTALRDECIYLVRRPNEIFLVSGEKAPAKQENETDLSQEELLKQPVYIEHRLKKDPRDIKILDPACGSGHFLLYAFDLLERIYKEAWEDSKSPKSEITSGTLREECDSLEEFRRVIPKLIIEHNLHGIDIDPRAVQIAALTLWLRAQKAWKNFGIKAVERPKVVKSNIVTAEPMPGDDEMRREFVAGLKPRVLGQLVDVVFGKMKLAGEAGSLLKIEEEIKDTVAEAKRQWLEGPKPEQQHLFPEMVGSQPKQHELHFDLEGVTDERFWGQAEDRALAALNDYAKRAENGFAIRRKLFAEDAARGFAFIDLCREQYDVVLMNPPFGKATESTEEYVDFVYGKPSSRGLFAPFILRAYTWTGLNGMLGSLSGRGAFFLSSYRSWRRKLKTGMQFESFLDLGFGVFEGPIVESMAFTSQRHTGLDGQLNKTIFLQALDTMDRDAAILNSLGDLCKSKRVYFRELSDFDNIPNYPFAYWLPEEIYHLFENWEPLKGEKFTVCQGMSTTNDFRFLRLSWEVPKEDADSWPPIAKGGNYSTYYSDLEMRVDWQKSGKNLLSNPKAVLRNKDHYFRPGITWTEGTTSCFSSRILPQGAAISGSGQGVFASRDNQQVLLGLLSYLQSRVVFLLLEGMVSSADFSQAGGVVRHYTTDLLGRVPIPHDNQLIRLAANAIEIFFIQRDLQVGEETDSNFLYLNLFNHKDHSLVNALRECTKSRIQNKARAIELASSNDIYVSKLTELDASQIAETAGPLPVEVSDDALEIDPQEINQLWQASEADLVEKVFQRFPVRRIKKLGSLIDRRLELLSMALRIKPETILEVLSEPPYDKKDLIDSARNIISYAVGALLGRWDIRIALDPSLAPKLPNPFDPLPVCPPGMLFGPDGLPAGTGQIVSEEWLRARTDANTLTPEGTGKNLTAPDSDYPFRINWDGIMADDPGFNGAQPHRNDIVRRVREVLELLWKDRAHEIEQEACDILGVKTLRDYFRKPSGFFKDHLKRYSKSRRKAPIYWPISTKSGSYTLWLYYHRLTDQILFTCVNDYLDPKLKQVAEDIQKLKQKGDRTREDERELEYLNDLEFELRDLREELLRIAQFWNPNLNDGVQITAAPLRTLFRHKPWQKTLKATWEKLEAGDYDWAHLAYSIWPERITEKCKTDKSLAIAHDLEHLYEEE